MAVKRSKCEHRGVTAWAEAMRLFIITSRCVFECELYFDTAHSVMCTLIFAEIVSMNNQLCGGVCNSIIKNSLMTLLTLITFQFIKSAVLFLFCFFIITCVILLYITGFNAYKLNSDHEK